MSENVLGEAGNQQGSLRQFADDPSETTRRTPIPNDVMRAYLLGTLHDGTLNKGKRFRICQKEREWLEFLQDLLQKLGYRSWIYKEGKTRNLYTLETLANFLDFTEDPLEFSSVRERVAYVRGFFDTEGGIPSKKEYRFYIQLVQSNYAKLDKIKTILKEISIRVGDIHN